MKIIRNRDSDRFTWPWNMACRGGRFLHIPSFTCLILQSIRGHGGEDRIYENATLKSWVFDEQV